MAGFTLQPPRALRLVQGLPPRSRTGGPRKSLAPQQGRCTPAQLCLDTCLCLIDSTRLRVAVWLVVSTRRRFHEDEHLHTHGLPCTPLSSTISPPLLLPSEPLKLARLLYYNLLLP